MRTIILTVILVLLVLWIGLYAHPESKPWEASLRYIKDERTKACFAVDERGGLHWGPYFAYVPCELLDKADWHYYER